MKIRRAQAILFLLITFLVLGCEKKAESIGDQDRDTEAVKAKTQVAENCPHDASKQECFICEPALRDKGRLWCQEHARYEDRCFLCHPEIKDEKRLFCQEHSLYEDECFLCHPELKKGATPADSISPQGKNHDGDPIKVQESEVGSKAISTGEGLWCKEHHISELECGICHPELLKTLEMGRGMKIRLPSVNSMTKAGVEIGKPQEEAGVSGPTFLCRVTYNQNQFAHITSLASGVVQHVLVDYGSEIKRGQPLAEIASPEIAKVKAEYVSALSEFSLKESAYQREKGLTEKQVSSQQEFEQADAEYRKARTDAATARQQLQNFGFPEEEIAALAKNPSASSLLKIRAPFAGTIVERHAVTGEAVSPSGPLFALADLSTMWLELSIPADAFAAVRLGDPVSAAFDGLPGVQFPGKLIWISSGIDATSRMIKARAVVENPRAILKDGLFGKARLPLVSKGQRLGLPEGAIQRIEGEDVIFVKLEEDLYEIRKVWKENAEAGRVSIVTGLLPTESVVVAGSYTLKSEFLKSRLGAGCAHE